MSLYDEYGKKRIQIKAGNPCMMHYKVGDKVDIDDGIYLAYEGIACVKKKKLIATFSEEKLYDKYGGNINIEEILNRNNPISILTSDIVIKRRVEKDSLNKDEKAEKEKREKNFFHNVLKKEDMLKINEAVKRIVSCENCKAAYSFKEIDGFAVCSKKRSQYVKLEEENYCKLFEEK